MTLSMIWAALIGYALGSIPSGLIITRLAGLGDIRNIGSGNIGTTNVLRTGKKSLAASTLIADAGKGAIAVLIVAAFWPGYTPMIAGIAAFLGHVFPVWLGFRGGKGVATYIGVLLGLAWPVGLIFCATWLFLAVVRRISSLSALTAAATAPIFAYVIAGPYLAATAGLLSLIIFAKHSANIQRLLAGTEPRIGDDKKVT